jgi:hypothetical protein
MTEYKVKISPELDILADVINVDLESEILSAVIDKLTEHFRCGTEIMERDIERNVKIEKIK